MALRWALAALLCLVAAIVAGVELRSDARAIFGEAGAEQAALSSVSGRSFAIGLEGEAPAARAASRAVAAALRESPLVARLSAGPAPPSAALLDFLWTYRFQIAAPEPEDITPARFAARLGEARAGLARAEGALLADRLLRDPSGAFARALEQLRRIETPLAARDGVWRARDGSGALIFGAFHPGESPAAEMVALTDRVRAAAAAHDARAHLIGPRLIAAEISQATSRASTRAVIVANALLILALAMALGSALALGGALLPPLLGAAAATVVVDAAFGHIHIVALGFGGALTGLSLDYPLHMASHRAHPQIARRVVALGAATTAVAFLALLGSDIPALRQTGLFVATGLSVAALAAIRLPRPARAARAPALSLRLPRWAPLLVAALGAAVLAVAPQAPPERLIAPPPDLQRSLDRLAQMTPPASARYEIRTEAADMTGLLARLGPLRAALARAAAAGRISGFDPIPLVEAAAPPAPPLEMFAQGLRRAGLDPAFAPAQRAAWLDAAAPPPLRLETLRAAPELEPFAARIERVGDGLRLTTRLYGAAGPPVVPAGSEVADMAQLVQEGLAHLRAQALGWLAAGAAAAAAVLALGLRDGRRALRVVLPAAAGALGAAAIMTLIGGGLGVFQIVALTLLVGIGVDYGLSVSSADGPVARREARRSVTLCASSTLIAFAAMALSDAQILREIGLTIVVGVLIVASLSISEGRAPDA